MDASSSVESLLWDESDEILIPPRSPSRLDFCMDDTEDICSVFESRGDPPTHALEVLHWDSIYDHRPYSFIEEEGLEVDIVESAPDPPQATNPQLQESPDASPTFPMPQEQPMDQVTSDPLAPVPVRPPPVQLQVDVQEPMPLSRTAPQRLNYPHRGYSRSALQQQKTLWHSRHERWAEWQSRLQAEEQNRDSETNNAYAGLAAPCLLPTESPPPVPTPPSGWERDLVDHPPKKHEREVNPSIYPRVGDVSALRDPYSAHIDRSFSGYPVWTLHKAVYVYDMYQKLDSFTPSVSVYDGTVKASMSSSTLSSYTSSASGDDDQESDSTLVADDSPVPQNHQPLKCDSSPPTSPSCNHLCGWDSSWYARWELLIDIFQQDHARFDSQALGISMKPAESPETEAPPPSPLEIMFRFTVEDESWDNDDDDEEEDYGTLLSRSSFQVNFEEECKRAMGFYTREYNVNAEMVM